jgi:hypothetical protein
VPPPPMFLVVFAVADDDFYDFRQCLSHFRNLGAKIRTNAEETPNLSCEHGWKYDLSEREFLISN